jgi:hypothetical protein
VLLIATLRGTIPALREPFLRSFLPIIFFRLVTAASPANVPFEEFGLLGINVIGWPQGNVYTPPDLQLRNEIHQHNLLSVLLGRYCNCFRQGGTKHALKDH